MTVLAWRPRGQNSPWRRPPVALTAEVPGVYAGHARFQPIHHDQLPPILRGAIGRIVEVGFAGIAPPSDPFAGQKLYLEWCSDAVFDGFLLPEQDLEFLRDPPDPKG